MYGINLISHCHVVTKKISLKSLSLSKLREMDCTIALLQNHMEGIMPDGRMNKIADLQETKLLRLFGLTNVHY